MVTIFMLKGLPVGVENWLGMASLKGRVSKYGLTQMCHLSGTELRARLERPFSSFTFGIDLG